MKTKKTLKILLSILVISLLTATAAFAVQQDPILSNDVEKVDPETLDKAGTFEEINGVTIYKDAMGGSVLANLPEAVSNSKEEQDAEYNFQKNHPEEEAKAVKEYQKTMNASKQSGTVTTMANYDTEYNPILIGYWNPDECVSGKSYTYARHTLGTRSYTPNGQYLLSYGNISWYNSSGRKALPYRNGSAQVEGQNVVDVKATAVFSLKDDGPTGKSATVTRNDFGPNQCPSSKYCKVICDLDTTTFKAVHGNTSDGLFYGHTWVPLTNYNP